MTLPLSRVKTTFENRNRPPGGPWQDTSGEGECTALEPLKLQCGTTVWTGDGDSVTQTVNAGTETEQSIEWTLAAYGFESGENFWMKHKRTVTMENGQSVRVAVKRIVMGDVSTALVSVGPADGSAAPGYYGFGIAKKVSDSE